jgi:hypothetical protein
LLKAFDNLVTNPSDLALEAFKRIAVPFNESLQKQSIQLAISYIQQAELMQTGSLVAYNLDSAVIQGTLRNGVPSSVVYDRPMATVRLALSKGKSLEDAIALGRNRLASIADTDAMLASRAGCNAAMVSSKRINRYRRDPDPNACDFCLLVSTRLYKVKNLMPTHNHCHCTVIPLATNQTMKTDKPDELEKDDIAVRQHGELGPVVVMKDHNFKGPNDF